MADEEKKVTILTEEHRKKLKERSVFSLPDNPSDKGWSAEQIKRKMYEPLLYLFDLVKNSQVDINEILKQIYTKEESDERYVNVEGDETVKGILYTEAGTPYLIGTEGKVGIRARVPNKTTTAGQYDISYDSNKKMYYANIVTLGNDGHYYALRVSQEGIEKVINDESDDIRIRKQLATEEYVDNKPFIVYVLKEVNYAELIKLRNNSKLVAGCKYRITDYVATTSQEDTKSAGHQFDIIVTALDKNTLDENARAIQHEGDTYFAGNDLNAWELKYSLDNDTKRFKWADEENGKGVIYWLKDEFNNECPYDFKNILIYENYTFAVKDLDASLNCIEQNTYGNVIKSYINENKQSINLISFVTSGNVLKCYDNIFGENCRNNTFGSECHDNIFGNECYGNTFGNTCYYNTFGNYCHSNTFGSNLKYNSFGNSCRENTFGEQARLNSFGNGCYGNKLYNYCYNNSFKNNCYQNVLGYQSENNSFGNNCYKNTLGNSGSKGSGNSFGNDCYSNTFGNNCIGNNLGNYCYLINLGHTCNYNDFGNKCNNIELPISSVQNIFENGVTKVKLSSPDDVGDIKNVIVKQNASGTSSVVSLIVNRNATDQKIFGNTKEKAKQYINATYNASKSDTESNVYDLSNRLSYGKMYYIEYFNYNINKITCAIFSLNWEAFGTLIPFYCVKDNVFVQGILEITQLQIKMKITDGQSISTPTNYDFIRIYELPITLEEYF